MRLLRFTNGNKGPGLEFEDVHDPKSREYAILSHTWNEEEVTYQDMKSGRAEEAKGYAKLLKFCELARWNGYCRFWADMCCIDKTNSAELSEAINSMFNWYSEAKVCMIYLSDVDEPEPNTSEESLTAQLRNSRWFTRGWTLQELLASREAMFYDRNWVMVGTKDSLYKIVADITGISENTLSAKCGEQTYTTADYQVITHYVDEIALNIANHSIAQKMSWAANRKTTRPEDIAYCLMGLFGVSMPLIYGEGGVQAFQRLQKEIIKITTDQTVFAWDRHETSNVRNGRMFAPSPEDFIRCKTVVPARRQLPVTGFETTNLGIRMQIKVYRPPTDDPRRADPQAFIGALDCEDYSSKERTGIHIVRSELMGDNVFSRVPGITAVQPWFEPLLLGEQSDEHHDEHQGGCLSERTWCCFRRRTKSKDETEARDCDGRIVVYIR